MIWPPRKPSSVAVRALWSISPCRAPALNPWLTSDLWRMATSRLRLQKMIAFFTDWLRISARRTERLALGSDGDRQKRCVMVEAAVADVDGLVAGDAEIRRGGPSFTADTLAGMADAYPGAELFTIVGDDAAAGLTSWERHEEVVAYSHLVVVDRPGAPVELPAGFDWLHVEVPRLEVSSTDLRARVRDGRPLDYLVTEPVLDLIAVRKLYRIAA